MRKQNKGICPLCGTFRNSLQRDHIIPRFKGGLDDLLNIQYICANCHDDKSREEGSEASRAKCLRRGNNLKPRKALSRTTCPLCGTLRKWLQRDRIIPGCLGGAYTSENTRFICANCHDEKSRLEMRLASTRNNARPEMKKILRETAQRTNSRSEMKKILSESAQRTNARPEIKQALSDRTKRIFADPIQNAVRSSTMRDGWTQEARANLGVSLTKSWSHPGTREKRSLQIKITRNRPDVKDTIRKSNVTTWSNPEIRDRHSVIMKGVFLRKKEQEALSCQ